MNTRSSTPEKCTTCDMDVVQYDGYKSCSEFCDQASDSTRADFLAAKAGKIAAGTWMLYPCAACGCVMEDEWHPGSVCYECAEKRRLAAMEAALLSSRKWLTNFHGQVSGTVVGQELRTLIAEIDTLLGGKDGEGKG